MSTLSKSSIEKLQTVDKRLGNIILEVSFDRKIQIIEGKRLLERQKELLKLKATKTLDSKHVTGEKPSLAIDIAPLTDDGKIDWNDTKAFHDLAKEVLKIADEKGIKVRWGGDWNMNGKTEDERFRDLVHFELV